MASFRTVLKLTSNDSRTLYVNITHIRACANRSRACNQFSDRAPLNVRQRGEDNAVRSTADQGRLPR
jgi:hypothetical protein